MKQIFPVIGSDKLHLLKIDFESFKFITFASHAIEITNIIMNSLCDFPCPDNYCPLKWKLMSLNHRMSNLTITEMTAGVGGNVLNFAKYFKHVNAIEIDPTRYQYLQSNIALYNLSSNVSFHNEDSQTLIMDKTKIKQDILFFDPPWGGDKYKLHKTLRIEFGGRSIEKVCHHLITLNIAKIIVLKLPNNYDFEYMYNELHPYRIFRIRLERMTIVVIKYYDQ